MRLVGTDLICNYLASICKRDQLYAVLIYATLIFYKERRAKMAHVIWYYRTTLWLRWLRLTVSSVSLLRSECSYSCSLHMLKKKKNYAVLVRGKWDHMKSLRSLLMSGHGKNEQFLSHSSAHQQFSFCMSSSFPIIWKCVVAGFHEDPFTLCCRFVICVYSGKYACS